jgi:hypothetical protein
VKEVLILDNFVTKQWTLLICLIGIVGSSAMFANAVFPNATNAMIAAAVGSGMFVLFIAITAELMIKNLQIIINDKKVQENDELIGVVVAKAVYRAIQDEKDSKTK